MKIRDAHMYHGAALIQIAEHPQFTAINSVRVGKRVVNSAYKINDHIAVYFKYACSPVGPSDEYKFTFQSDHIACIRALAGSHDVAHVALVCVDAREICVITADELAQMVQARQRARGGRENQYVVNVTAEDGKRLRAYMDYPGRRNTALGQPLVRSRKAFPEVLFS
jgi:hypothetical protein